MTAAPAILDRDQHAPGADRPRIAHLFPTPAGTVALCGTRILRSRPAGAGAEKCVVCLDLVSRRDFVSR